MSTASSNPAKTIPADEWVELILRPADPTDTWTAIFARLRDLALSNNSPAALHRETIVPDRLLAESAWNLWQEFPRCAPTVVDELKKFWVAKPGVGTAVLILDGFSLRELPLIVQAGQARGVPPVRVEARGSEVPSETDRFAEALGLPGRSKLYNNQAPGTFIFTGPDVYTDLLDAPLADCQGSITTDPRLFIWHKWPDEPLIHLHEDKKDGPQIVAAQPVKVRVPDFSNPKRPKTCLEVDFPLVPINALSALEGNAGKPIYQMSKWWARRRSCVFRAMLIAAATEAPVCRNPDGSPVLDAEGQPKPDDTETNKTVWDLYYANHQAAENFKHLKVLDCFMGGGTTLVEGSRLGFPRQQLC